MPVGAYQRIASLNAVADHLLLHLVEPERVVLVTGHSATAHPDAFRFGGRPTAATSAEIEEVLALQPDLVVASIFTDEAWLARLREAGVAVFDLGDMRGASTTLANIDALGALLDQRPRAARLRDRYSLQLRALEDAVPPEAVPSCRDHLRRRHLRRDHGSATPIRAPRGSLGCRRGRRLRRLAPVQRRAAARPGPHGHHQQGMASVLWARAGVLAACQPAAGWSVPGHFDSDPGLGTSMARRPPAHPPARAGRSGRRRGRRPVSLWP